MINIRCSIIDSFVAGAAALLKCLCFVFCRVGKDTSGGSGGGIGAYVNLL